MKKKFQLKIHIFQKFLAQNQMTFFQKVQKSLRFFAYNQFGVSYVLNCFYQCKVLCSAHLLHKLNDVIGPIEKMLEAVEQKVSAQNSHFSEISISKSDHEKCEF